MAKRSREPADSATLQQAVASFTRQQDRGTALVAAAWVDDALEACLRAFLRRDDKALDEVFQPEGALGSFSTRIKLSFLLGLIGPTVRHDLDIIRSIRNDFAHFREQLRFTHHSVRDRCGRLHAARAYELGTGEPIRSPRKKYLVTSYFLADYLLTGADNVKPPRMRDEDAYGAGIRRTAKSTTLARIASHLGVSDEPEDVPNMPK